MSTTSKKHEDFVKEKIGDKSVRDLPGIGDTQGGKLKEDGYDKAYMVLGQFLALGKDEKKFKKWLTETCKASSEDSNDFDDCYQCLKEYCEIHMPSTSREHLEFLREPIGNKSVRILPGIGKENGSKLESKGYDKAYMVLGKFLDLKKDGDKFKKWLKDTEASSKDSNHLHACYQCLKEYCEIHMPSTSKKHVEFVKEPMRNKSVRKLPGICDTYVDRLESKGYDKAYMVLGQFLALGKDEEKFKEWLMTKCGVSSKDPNDLHACYKCLKEYCEIHMPTTSKKHDEFVREPIGDKPVKKLPGIGKEHGGKLESKGYDKAYMVLGMFLVLKKDEKKFEAWLKEKCNAKSNCQKDCSQALTEWCALHL